MKLKTEGLFYLRARLVYAAGLREVALGKADLAKATMVGVSMVEERNAQMDLFEMRRREVQLLEAIIEQVERAEI